MTAASGRSAADASLLRRPEPAGRVGAGAPGRGRRPGPVGRLVALQRRPQRGTAHLADRGHPGGADRPFRRRGWPSSMSASGCRPRSRLPVPLSGCSMISASLPRSLARRGTGSTATRRMSSCCPGDGHSQARSIACASDRLPAIAGKPVTQGPSAGLPGWENRRESRSSRRASRPAAKDGP